MSFKVTFFVIFENSFESINFFQKPVYLMIKLLIERFISLKTRTI